MLDIQPAWVLLLATGAKENGNEIGMSYVTLSESTHSSVVNFGENGHTKIRITNPHSQNLCISGL